MGVINEIYQFIELSDKLFGDIWKNYDNLNELEKEYIRSLRTVKKIYKLEDMVLSDKILVKK